MLYKPNTFAPIRWRHLRPPNVYVTENVLSLTQEYHPNQLNNSGKVYDTDLSRTAMRESDPNQGWPVIRVFPTRRRRLDLSATYSAALQAFKRVAIEENKKSRVTSSHYFTSNDHGLSVQFSIEPSSVTTPDGLTWEDLSRTVWNFLKVSKRAGNYEYRAEVWRYGQLLGRADLKSSMMDVMTDLRTDVSEDSVA